MTSLWSSAQVIEQVLLWTLRYTGPRMEIIFTEKNKVAIFACIFIPIVLIGTIYGNKPLDLGSTISIIFFSAVEVWLIFYGVWHNRVYINKNKNTFFVKKGSKIFSTAISIKIEEIKRIRIWEGIGERNAGYALGIELENGKNIQISRIYPSRNFIENWYGLLLSYKESAK